MIVFVVTMITVCHIEHVTPCAEKASGRTSSQRVSLEASFLQYCTELDIKTY